MAERRPLIHLNGAIQEIPLGDTVPAVTTNANLTGDVTSVGNATTLPVVNGNVGTFNSLTVNAKGQVTAANNVTSLLTAPLGANANTAYVDNSNYFGYATVANGFPAAGNFTGARYGTVGTQRLQVETGGLTYLRAWINATATWTAWTLLLDGEDFTAKGQLHVGTGANAYAMLNVGSDGQVLTASAAAASGVTWATPATGSGANAAGTYLVQTATNAPVNAQVLASLATGILKVTTATGVLSTAVAADFPTLNQSTSGSAATLTTPRNIHGGAFNGSADVTNVIGSAFGGTGNGFTTFAGPATAAKTFTLPNVNAVVLTDAALVTGAQGGTGVANTGKTLTLGGNLTTSGAFACSFTLTAATTLTLPVAGTLAVTTDLPATAINLLMVQTAVTSTTTTAATAVLIDATNFLWDSRFVPVGKSAFLEILGSSTAGSPTVVLTALGSTVAVATLAGTASTTTVRTRSAALGVALVSGTEYQVRLFNSVAGTASLKVARLIIV